MNNIQPRTRADRDSQSQKDKIEKDYIDKRGGYEARNISAGQLIHQADIKSTLYIPESLRFDKDYQVYDKQIRDQKFKQQQQFYQQQRQGELNKNQEFWQRQQNNDQKQEEKLNLKKIDNNSRNQNIEGFNLINMEYNQNKQGAELKQKDQNQEIRYLMRQTNLSQKSNSNYNIMTGQERVHVQVPSHLEQAYNQKIQQNK